MDQFGPVKGFVIAKFFADKNFLAMNTFLLGVGLASSNSLETVEKVRQILKESLLTDDNSASAIQERMDKKLVDVFGEGLYRLWVNSTYNYSAPEKKSFYIKILVKNAGNIVLTAEYKELKTLRDIAAHVVAKSFTDEKEVEKLEGEIPSYLLEDIKQFL